MQRVGRVAIVVAVALLGWQPARADCAASAGALKARLAEIQDQKAREEVRLLLEKAVLDERHGRTGLCETALEQASKMLN